MSEDTPRKTVGEPAFGGYGAMAAWMKELIPYGILTTDREFRITSWNDWLTSHSGFTSQQVLGKKLTELFPEVATTRFDERYERALAGEVSVLSAALHKYLLPFPSTVPESGLPHMLQTVRIAPIPGPDGATGTITIIEDVTQREFQASVVNRQQALDRLLSGALATLLQSAGPDRGDGWDFCFGPDGADARSVHQLPGVSRRGHACSRMRRSEFLRNNGSQYRRCLCRHRITFNFAVPCRRRN